MNETTIELANTEYDLYDSETGELIPRPSGDSYISAILESIQCPQAEGHVLYEGRRVYAQ
jgi:hypothetical protein